MTTLGIQVDRGDRRRDGIGRECHTAVEAVGDMTQGEAVTRKVDDRRVMSFRLDPVRKLLGAMAVDDGKAIRAARRIIDRGIVVDPETLRDLGLISS